MLERLLGLHSEERALIISLSNMMEKNCLQKAEGENLADGKSSHAW